MKKLTLKVDEIEVTGFEVVRGDTRRGTVNGADALGLTRITFCDPNDTCFQTCNQATCLC